MVTKHKEVCPMQTIYTNSPYCERSFRFTGRRSLFWNKVADVLLCGACTMGVIVSMFFLFTL